MSQALYLVRLRSVFRVREIYDVRVDRLPAEALFATRQTAEEYVATHQPITYNPFARTDETMSVDLERGMICVDFYDQDKSTSRVLDCFLFTERLAQAGIELPDEWDQEPRTWGLWWDVITLNMKAQECDELRRQLELPTWSDNPFTRTFIYLDQGAIHLSYAIPLAALNDLVTGYGLTLPELSERTGSDFRAAEISLVSWWDETAPRMTDEQKAALWRLLDPQPWEIVEVELEEEEKVI
jgi:hypothetical protein